MRRVCWFIFLLMTAVVGGQKSIKASSQEVLGLTISDIGNIKNGTITEKQLERAVFDTSGVQFMDFRRSPYDEEDIYWDAPPLTKTGHFPLFFWQPNTKQYHQWYNITVIKQGMVQIDHSGRIRIKEMSQYLMPGYLGESEIAYLRQYLLGGSVYQATNRAILPVYPLPRHILEGVEPWGINKYLLSKAVFIPCDGGLVNSGRRQVFETWDWWEITNAHRWVFGYRPTYYPEPPPTPFEKKMEIIFPVGGIALLITMITLTLTSGEAF